MYGGWSGRIQISAGEFQYDSSTLEKNACPCNADAFRIAIEVTVATDETIEILSAQPAVYF